MSKSSHSGRSRYKQSEKPYSGSFEDVSSGSSGELSPPDNAQYSRRQDYPRLIRSRGQDDYHYKGRGRSLPPNTIPRMARERDTWNKR